MSIATFNLQPLKDQDITPAQSLHDLEDLTEVLNVGDFLSTPLGPDTYVFDVIKVTKRTATLRMADSSFDAYTDDPDSVREQKRGVVWVKVYPSEDCTLERTVRINHDGVLNNGTLGTVFSKCMLINGKPVKRIEYGA